jgi:hypothetical protein
MAECGEGPGQHCCFQDGLGFYCNWGTCGKDLQCHECGGLNEACCGPPTPCASGIQCIDNVCKGCVAYQNKDYCNRELWFQTPGTPSGWTNIPQNNGETEVNVKLDDDGYYYWFCGDTLNNAPPEAHNNRSRFDSDSKPYGACPAGSCLQFKVYRNDYDSEAFYSARDPSVVACPPPSAKE